MNVSTQSLVRVSFHKRVFISRTINRRYRNDMSHNALYQLGYQEYCYCKKILTSSMKIVETIETVKTAEIVETTETVDMRRDCRDYKDCRDPETMETTIDFTFTFILLCIRDYPQSQSFPSLRTFMDLYTPSLSLLSSSHIHSHVYVLFTFVFIIISLQSHIGAVITVLVSQRTVKESFIGDLDIFTFLMDLIIF